MEDNPFENTVNATENCWMSSDSTAPLPSSQQILLSGDESNFSHSVHGKEVVIMASQASAIDQEGVGSSMVKFKPIVNYDWDCKLEYGNLVVCHTNKIYFAYVLRSYNQGTATGIVRVTNMKTTQRTLLKSFVGKVVDINFADSERVILGAVDSMGNLFVYEFFEEKDQSLGHKLLLSCMRPDMELSGNIHRLIWCSYIGEDDKPSSEVVGSNELVEAPLDDSLMLLLTHNEIAELWHIDLITRTSSSVQVSTDSLDCGYYVIRNHSQAITDAAFSPDATAVATASLDGDIKFFQVDVSDPTPPKCIHYWQPHEGKPISFLHFLDDHKTKNPQAHLWKFAVTGCNENQTIRIWDCQNWSCLQTVTFIPPVGDLLSMDEDTSGDFRDRTTCSIIKAKFDPSSSYLVLSDMKRRVLYVLEVSFGDNEAQISSISEFLLMNPCLSFAVVDACKQKGTLKINNGDNGFQLEQDWSLNDNLEDDFECGRLSKSSVSVRLYTVHGRALQELHMKFVPASTLSDHFGKARDVAGITSDFCSVGSIRDPFLGLSDDLPSISKGDILSPSSNFSAASVLSAPIHASQTSPLNIQPVLPFQQERQSLSGSTLPLTPFLLAPDVFVSPRSLDVGRSGLSSSVDFGGDEDDEEEEDDDDDHEVEVRGDVEGADRDMPDGGSRVRSIGTGDVGAGGHFFDRGGDGGGDGDSSGASTASQEVTEILGGVEEAMGGLDVAADLDKNSEDGETGEDDKFSVSHLRTIDPQPTQTSQPPIIHPHHSFLQQQHNIAHHIPNMIQVPSGLHLYKEKQSMPSSTNTLPSLGHQSLLSSTQSPRSMHQPLYHHGAASQPSPMNTKWPQAAGIINVDELMRKSEAFEMSNRKSHDGAPPFIEAGDLEKRFFGTKDNLTEVQPTTSTSVLQDLFDLVRSQGEELKSINSMLHQQSHLENNLRNANLQIETLSKEVQRLSSNLEVANASSSGCRIDDEKVKELVEKFCRRSDDDFSKLFHLFEENMKRSMSELFPGIVSADIRTNVLPNIENIFETLKEKISSELNQKLSSIDTTVKNSVAKVFKSKPVTDSIGQCVLADLKGNLKMFCQEALTPAFDKGCSNIIQQLNTTFQLGTQQYLKGLEVHLNQIRKSIENQKFPIINQMKTTADSLSQNNTQYKQANAELLENVKLIQLLLQDNSKQPTLDEGKIVKILKENSEFMTNQVRDIVSEKLSCILRDHQVAIKDQFESALRSVTPAPSSTSFSDHHHQLKAQITQNLNLAKFNTAFQQALSATDLNLVEFTCENADISVVFAEQCFLSQSVLLSLIQQLAADLSTKTELKYRYLDEAIVSLEPNDPVTKEHLSNVMEQLCSSLNNFLEHKGAGPLDRDLRKLLKRANALWRSHPRHKY